MASPYIFKVPLEEIATKIVVELNKTETEEFKNKNGDIQILELNKAMGEIIKNGLTLNKDFNHEDVFSSSYLSKNFKIVWNDSDIGSGADAPKDMIIDYFSNKGNSHDFISGMSPNHIFGGNVQPTFFGSNSFNEENIKSFFDDNQVFRYLSKKKNISDCFGFNFQMFLDIINSYYEENVQTFPKVFIDLLLKAISNSMKKLIFNVDNVLSEEWTTATMYVNFKGGNVDDPSKYRPLICLPGMVRLCDFVVMDFIHNYSLENELIDKRVQKGHLVGTNGCWEHRVDVNKRLLQLSKDKSSKFALFLDIQNAFGSVNYELMWKILTKLKFPTPIIEYLRKYYKQLKVEYKGGSFSWKNGLLQGSATSNILFLIYMDQAIKHFHQMGKKMGLFSLEVMRDNSFVFVDDCTFIMEKNDKMNETMEVLYRTFKDFGLSISPNKTYYVEFLGNDIDLKIGQDTIQRAPDTFKYLGHPLVISPTFISQIKEKVQHKITEINKLPIDSKVKVCIYQQVIQKRLNIYLELCIILGIDYSMIEWEEKYFFKYHSYVDNYEHFSNSRKNKIAGLAKDKLLKSSTPIAQIEFGNTSVSTSDWEVFPSLDELKETISSLKSNVSFNCKTFSKKLTGFYPNCFVEHID